MPETTALPTFRPVHPRSGASPRTALRLRIYSRGGWVRLSRLGVGTVVHLLRFLPFIQKQMTERTARTHAGTHWPLHTARVRTYFTVLYSSTTFAIVSLYWSYIYRIQHVQQNKSPGSGTPVLVLRSPALRARRLPPPQFLSARHRTSRSPRHAPSRLLLPVPRRRLHPR